MEFEEELRAMFQESRWKRKAMVGRLKQGYLTFYREDSLKERVYRREAIITPSTVKDDGEYQFTIFDVYGPIGDFKFKSLREGAERIIEYGFEPLNPNYLEIIR